MRVTAAALATMVMAQGAWAADAAEERIAERIRQLDSRLVVETVADSPLTGLYEVVLQSGEVLYSDAAGEYVLSGQLFHIVDGGTVVNLSEQRLQAKRVDMLAQVPDEDRVIFPAEGETRARIQVFTDVDCVYCRRLHQEVKTLNAMGIQVDYLAFPRGGARSAAAGKMSAIWCAQGEARRELMSRAKEGENLQPVDCDNPVLDEFRLGQQLGVTGTPALVLDDGRLIPGYMPAPQLASLLGL